MAGAVQQQQQQRADGVGVLMTPWGQAGLVWPLPGAESVSPNPAWAATYRAAGFTWVRMDVPVSRDRANADASVRVMRDAGLHVWPILSWPSAEPDVDAMCGYAEWYVETFPDSQWVELGNEPWILDKVPAGEYLRVAGPMAETLLEVHPDVKVILAMDLFDHVSGDERGWPGVDRVIELHCQLRAVLRGSASVPQPVSGDVLGVALARPGVRGHL